MKTLKCSKELGYHDVVDFVNKNILNDPNNELVNILVLPKTMPSMSTIANQYVVWYTYEEVEAPFNHGPL